MKNILIVLLMLCVVLNLSSCMAMMGGMMKPDKAIAGHHRKSLGNPIANGHSDKVVIHQYLYYPDFDVYYDIHDRVYFYLSDDNWIVSPTLPEHYVLNDYRVSLTMESEIPYSKYQNHKKKYAHNDHTKHN